MLKFLRQNGLYLLAGILVFIYSFSKQGEKLNPRQFEEKMKASTNAQLVDVRTPAEYEEGHIRKAQNIDWNADGFDEKISKLDKNKPVFVYCRSGKRSNAAANRMRSLGFTTIYDLDGGITQWQADDLPIVVPAVK